MVKNLLNDLCLASGLKVNIAKSRASALVNVSRAKKERILGVTSIPFTASLDKYTGFPIFRGRQKREHFDFILDRISKKLASWNGRLLHKEGKVTLVKSVLNTVHIYPMQIF